MAAVTLKTSLDLTDFDYLEEEYDYQLYVIKKLKATVKEKINQSTIDEIILWKMNRYAQVNNELLQLLNKIYPNMTLLEDVQYSPVKLPLKTKNIRLSVELREVAQETGWRFEDLDRVVYP